MQDNMYILEALANIVTARPIAVTAAVCLTDRGYDLYCSANIGIWLRTVRTIWETLPPKQATAIQSRESVCRLYEQKEMPTHSNARCNESRCKMDREAFYQ